MRTSHKLGISYQTRFVTSTNSIRLDRNEKVFDRKSELLIVVMKYGNSYGAKEQYFK